MVKGKIYKLANLHKNKINNFLTSYNQGQKDGVGWLWTSNCPPHHNSGVFRDGDAFVCLGKKENDDDSVYYGITIWYEALGPDGKIHRFTPAMRSTYFRNP